MLRRAAVGAKAPVLVGGHAAVGNAARLLEHADGAIVGEASRRCRTGPFPEPRCFTSLSMTRRVTAAGGLTVDTYNYATFVGDDDFLAFRSALPVGSVAPDAAVTVAATGEPAQLSEYWRDGDLVIEFGSLT